MMTTFDKALAAFIGALLTLLAFKLPILADAGLQSAVEALAVPAVGAIAAYFIPNKPVA